MKRALQLAALILGLCVTLTPAERAGANGQHSDPPANTPIQHLVTILQENHTFDNYFGTFPGADGVPEDV